MNINKLIPIIVIFFLGGAALTYFYVKRVPVTPATKTTSRLRVTPTPMPAGYASKVLISETTGNFYKTYDTCLKNPPAAATGKVSVYCQNNTGLTTTSFADNLDKGGTAKAGADPVFCAQNIPESMDVDPDIRITENTALAFVNEKFGPTQIKIQIDLKSENGKWKIDNITCPLPSSGSDSTLTADWKTYTNNLLGFSFKYPQNYRVEERSKGFFVITSPDEHTPQGGISLDTRLEGSYASYSGALAKLSADFTVTRSVRVNDWTVFEAIGKEGMLRDQKFKIALAIYKTGAIGMETLANSPYAGIFEQILATFKFTN